MEKPFKQGNTVELKPQAITAFKKAVEARRLYLIQAHLNNDSTGLPWWDANRKRNDIYQKIELDSTYGFPVVAKVIETDTSNPDQPIFEFEKDETLFSIQDNQQNIGIVLSNLELTRRKLSAGFRRTFGFHWQYFQD